MTAGPKISPAHAVRVLRSREGVRGHKPRAIY